jgi:exodeoxyribonuclease V alpha subunit
MPGEALELVLTAVVDDVVYQAPDGSFTVVRAACDAEKDPLVATGPLGTVHPGDTFKLTGAFEVHPRFGRRFRVAAAIPVTPTTAAGIMRFLASGRFEGIGRKTAERVVAALGARTFELLLDERAPPKIPGVSSKKIARLAAALRAERGRIDCIAFLAGLGLGVTLANRAIEVLGADAATRVREDPYALSIQVDGIGFLTADRIAAGLGVAGDHPKRLRAGLLHALDALADHGHVCAGVEVLLARAARLLGSTPEALEPALAALEAASLVIVERDVGDEPAVYRPDLHAAEREVARLLAHREGRSPILESIDDLEDPLPAMLSDEQREAVVLLLTQPVAILTGGPGVGKTTVIQAVARAAEAAGRRVVLAAPTGRAARRITETSGMEASTIHKLIGLKPDAGRRSFAPSLRVEADALVVDETSMLDLKLFANLLRQTDRRAALILVGDKDQLPSVGPGDVLADLIRSGVVPVARLERIFRQETAGLIVTNAHRALAGIPPVLPKGGELADFYFMERDDPGEAAELIRDLVAARLPARMGFDPRNDIQVLAPMYRGQAGADRLNAMLQEALNGSAPSVTRGGATFRVGDRVIYTRNDYDRELANGDLGRVTAVDPGRGAVTIVFGEAVHRFESFSDVKLAFALTVHKSQGSEYPVVILPLLLEHHVMLRRAVVYTAMTRARRLLVMVGQHGALARALAETRRDARGSLLRQRLEAGRG